MDIGKSFTFIFDDEDWLKQVVIGGLIMMIPIVNFAAFGYLVRVMQNVKTGHDVPLPEWDSFGEYFMDGVKLLVGFLVYSLPALLVACVVLGTTIVLAGAAENSNMNPDTVMPFLILCMQCGIFIFALIPMIFAPAIFIRFAETGEIGAMLQFGKVFEIIQTNSTNYVIVLFLSGAVLYFIAPLGVIACLIGAIFTQWWGYLVFAYLTGQLMKEATVSI